MGKLSHEYRDMKIVHRAKWRVTQRRNMKNTSQLQRERQVTRDLFTPLTLWYLEMSGITTALLSWANGLLVTRDGEYPRMTVKVWKKAYFEVMNDKDVWTLFMLQQSSNRVHIMSMLKERKTRERLSNRWIMPLILSPTAARSLPYLFLCTKWQRLLVQYIRTVVFHKLLIHLDFQTIMSRLVGNQRKASALEKTTGYNQGMQASCSVGHVCPPKQLACVLKSPFTQLNASNVCQNLLLWLLLAEKKTFRRETNMWFSVMAIRF